MSRKISVTLLGVLGVILIGVTTWAFVGAGRVSATAQEADFGQCNAMMAQTGPNHHADMMGMDNYGQVVRHCQTMHDPPYSR